MRQSTDRTIHRLQAFHFYLTPCERFINSAMLTSIKLAPVFSALSVVKIGFFCLLWTKLNLKTQQYAFLNVT